MIVTDLDEGLFELKQAIAHIDLGLKAYRAALRDEIDASRLLEPLSAEISRLINTAENMRKKIETGLAEPASVEP